MKAFRLYTVFHGNLDFSALPDRDLPLVITRCYWPLLSLAEKSRIPLGIEMPARTLQRLADEDPEWLKSFRELAERGLVELVASGLSQVIGPLVPSDVNRLNFELGRAAYRELLGFEPTTWFVNEQTFSKSLAPLYAETGARALVMEWNNPASRRRELRPLRCQPARLAAGDGSSLDLLWNDSVVFQKLQRVAHGQIPTRDYLELLASLEQGEGNRALCAYGGDVEIFDYRPGNPVPAGCERGIEHRRLAACLRLLAADPRFEFVLPRDVTCGMLPGPEVELTCADEPLMCKKQPRYNPTRWAVSGRDGLGMNTRCFALRRMQRAADGLAGRVTGSCSDDRSLVRLWGSDFRTRATEERASSFHTQMGAAQASLQSRLEKLAPELSDDEQIVVTNPSEEDWNGDPIEIPLQLAPGRVHTGAVVAEPFDALPPDAAQLEVHSRYRDGSVRRAMLVLEPRLAAGDRVAIRLVPAPEELHAATSLPVDSTSSRIHTESVQARFLTHRGGALAQLSFSEIHSEPLLGTLDHGSFDEIAYTPDFYSGHVVAVREDGVKITDLSHARRIGNLHAGAVRATLGFKVRTSLGEWTKLYRVYRRRPRIDLIHGLQFQEARLGSLRLGIVTALPNAFERGSLGYATVNGGTEVESFNLGRGARLAQHQPVSAVVTASSCLGATEGWVSFGDAKRGVAVIGDRAQAAAAPLLEFSDVDDRFFMRMHHSLAESDETRATFFRGFRRVAFALVGHRGELDGVRRTARAIERGLVYRTERGVGIARGL